MTGIEATERGYRFDPPRDASLRMELAGVESDATGVRGYVAPLQRSRIETEQQNATGRVVVDGKPKKRRTSRASVAFFVRAPSGGRRVEWRVERR